MQHAQNKIFGRSILIRQDFGISVNGSVILSTFSPGGAVATQLLSLARLKGPYLFSNNI